ncbi:NADH-dependent flavin oxidoreductase [Secundilactobacillus pentosiphilus]|uniref:NADH-dependent flavin oxidoreductase n=1 Tax=Secundilactobacillus pentosiphilus TaxID=1714682 RepID=A0A1Z5ILA3_9LACO|nr:NADH-dependent flavin oxidoreductase [Secundilactobacillus pentosiphilus]
MILANYNFLKPYKFENGAEIKNRVVMAPMTEASAFADGRVTSDEVNYYAQRAGGPGMIITAVANVTPHGKGIEGELSVADDKFIPGLRKIATAIKSKGSKAILQIFHAGRMTNSQILRGVQPESASDIPANRPGAETPRPLKEAEIEEIITAFGQATRRAIEAGFDGVEIHGANTYLVQQFFSPHSNRRTDKWGGSFENRTHFPLAVIKACQDAINANANTPFILGYRLSPEEVETPGIRLADTLKLVDLLGNQPIDYLHISMGYVWRTSLNDKDDSEPIIDKIKQVLNQRLPLISVGAVETPADAAKVIDDDIDFVGIGRELLREPQWVQKIEKNDENAIRYTISISDLPELGITDTFWEFINGYLKSAMHISNQPDEFDKKMFAKKLAPHEG